MAFAPAARLDDLWSGDLLATSIGGRSVLLVRLGSDVFAYENRCAHQGQPLHQGKLDEEVLQCPVHHWTYDVRTGVGVNPANACLRRFQVKLEAGTIYVDVESS